MIEAEKFEFEDGEMNSLHVIKYAGYIDYSHFEQVKWETSQGLIQFGGSFSQSLGHTLMLADRNNALKIMRYWAQDCEKHRILYLIAEAKRKAITSPENHSTEL